MMNNSTTRNNSLLQPSEDEKDPESNMFDLRIT